jgi:D-alanyl-lipoteichoic acid acyltransferase DltB (MBOAT superfamily)
VQPPGRSRRGRATTAVPESDDGPRSGISPSEGAADGDGGDALVFNSLQFVAFYAVAALGYFVLPVRFRWMWLLAASFYFYGVAQPAYLLLILAATAVAFFAAQKIEAAAEKPQKQRWLWAAIALLAGNLLLFKYTSFINETIRAALNLAGTEYPVGVISILMPIGISFYTFQLIGYLLDVFRGAKAERHAGIFALYVTFFPKMISGPIERGRNLLPQLHAPKGFDYATVVSGLQLVAWGAFKKIVVADRLAPYVANVYGDPHAWEGVSLAFATWIYAFQLYFDFAGYTDMALGTALILGFKLQPNFNRPYFATSIQDFWKRWHISLTSWLTDYVYTPITRMKSIKIKWYNLMLIALFITFVTSGLWHGAQWTFVAWGALHGTYIVIALLLQKPWNQFAAKVGLTKRPQLYRWGKIVFTFTLVCLAYVLFRAQSLADAGYIYAHLFSGWGEIYSGLSDVIWSATGYPEFALALGGIAVVMGVELFQGSPKAKEAVAAFARTAWMRWSLYFAGALSIVLLGAFYGQAQPFIYFRF